MLQNRLIKYFFIITCLQFAACSALKMNGSIEFERQSFEKTREGICRRPNRVILGLESDYEVASIQLINDSVYGTINYYAYELNPKTNKVESRPYDRVLYIYKIDTLNCDYHFLGNSKNTGDFSVEMKKSSGVVGFSYYKLDAESFNLVDAVIFRRVKRL